VAEPTTSRSGSAIFAALVGADPFEIRSRTHAIRIAD
jgi:hypothetical protein